MSVIDTAAHSVVGYVSGSSKPFSGQRLATVCYKMVSDKNSALYNVKRENKCVSLPVISDTEITGNITVLTTHIRTMLEVAQNKMVRELVDAGSKSIQTSDVDMAAIIEYLDNSNESGRLTKESVAAWFDETIADTLMLALSEKLGVSDTPSEAEAKKVEVIANEFRVKIAALAGGKTSYEPKVCASIIKCLDLVPSGDVLASKFTARLNKMIADGQSSNLIDAL